MVDRTRTYIYMGDVSRQLPYTFAEVPEAWERDRVAPFELARSAIGEELGEVMGVRLQGSYVNPRTATAVIEYAVNFKGPGGRGTLSVTIVHAEEPERALARYHEA